MTLKVKGVTYDVGMPVIKGGITRETLTSDVVAREMKIISEELHCTAVRITGQDMERLKMAANITARQGLDVWLSPSLHDADEQETFNQIVDAAHVCEELRKYDVQVVLVIGCELSVFMAGLIPGNNGLERLAVLSDPSRWTEELFAQGSPVERLNNFLARAATEARKRFSGPLTYAAGLWEDIDWRIFDFVGIDAYRDANNSNHFRDLIRKYKDYGKPIVVTEFGCCTYVGAEDQGSMGWLVIDRDSQPWRLKKSLIRDEGVQARYLTDMLALFEGEGVEGAFVFTFVSPSYPSSADPDRDLDVASFSIVRSWDGIKTSRYPLPWEPKEAFHAIARYYGNPS
ncbi:hypothetical protein GCM10025857_24040 [Alicyclobacillus contaminans]|uniref:hypothetical protein n=1 Tax=Alicyclobacillus contaminans TaxID=392016 RepID=UPI000416AA89|nr:hypothetical protein [Alicyclobacillus contaminans]GMA51047.1 hypothetical protein GCM10025857_24040 [Alicyclobacillus contaminans]